MRRSLGSVLLLVCGMAAATEPVLLFLSQRYPMGEKVFTDRETAVQIRVFTGDLFYIIRVNGNDNALVDTVVNLGQLMAFILVDEKNISKSVNN